MAKSGVIRIDFSKEEEGGGGGRIPTTWKKGDYHVKILAAKTGRSPEKDTPFVEVKFKVLEGRRKGSTFSERLYITPKSLKRIRLLLEAIGVKVPKSAVNLPLAKLKGKSLWVELELQEKEGYDPKMAIAFEGFMSEDDYEESDEDDDDDEDEDDEDTDDDDDDEDEDDDDEDDEDEDDDDDDDDDDEEEEVKPKRRARKSRTRTKKAPAKKTRKKKDDIEDLDLDDL